MDRSEEEEAWEFTIESIGAMKALHPLTNVSSQTVPSFSESADSETTQPILCFG